jgi:hypothetical protein
MAQLLVAVPRHPTKCRIGHQNASVCGFANNADGSIPKEAIAQFVADGTGNVETRHDFRLAMVWLHLRGLYPRTTVG